MDEPEDGIFLALSNSRKIFQPHESCFSDITLSSNLPWDLIRYDFPTSLKIRQFFGHKATLQKLDDGFQEVFSDNFHGLAFVFQVVFRASFPLDKAE